MIGSSQRPLPDNTRHSQQTNIQAPGGIRTQDLSRRAACGHSPAEIVYADQVRTVQSMAVTVGVVESHRQAWNSRHSHAQSIPTSRPGKPVVCFYCQKLGHIQEKCFLHLAQLRKQWLAATSQPCLGPQARKIVGVMTRLSPRIEVQVAKLRLPVLPDSESVRSLISFDHFLLYWLWWSRGSALAFGTQVRGFKPGQSRRIFKGEKSSPRLPSEGK